MQLPFMADPCWAPGCPSEIGGRYSAVSERTTVWLPKPTRRRKIVETDADICTFISFVCGKVAITQGDGYGLPEHDVPPVPLLVKPSRAASTSAALIASG